MSKTIGFIAWDQCAGLPWGCAFGMCLPVHVVWGRFSPKMRKWIPNWFVWKIYCRFARKFNSWEQLLRWRFSLLLSQSNEEQHPGSFSCSRGQLKNFTFFRTFDSCELSEFRLSGLSVGNTVVRCLLLWDTVWGSGTKKGNVFNGRKVNEMLWPSGDRCGEKRFLNFPFARSFALHSLQQDMLLTLWERVVRSFAGSVAGYAIHWVSSKLAILKSGLQIWFFCAECSLVGEDECTVLKNLSKF